MIRFISAATLLLCLWCGPVHAAVFFSDQFEVSSDTPLENHTPNTIGSTWGVNGGNTGAEVLAASNEVAPESGQVFANNPTTPGSADYSCTAIGKTGGTGGSNMMGPSVRDDGSNARYVAWIRGSTGVLTLSWYAAGGNGDLGTYTIPGFSASTEYSVKLEALGTGATVTLRVWVDGACVIPASNCESSGYSDSRPNRITAPNSPGFRLRLSDARITSLVCEDDTAAPGAPTALLRRGRGR